MVWNRKYKLRLVAYIALLAEYQPCMHEAQVQSPTVPYKQTNNQNWAGSMGL